MALTPQQVLLQLLDENDYYIRDLLDNAPPDCLHWQPDSQTNSIAVQVWHVARACDVFLTQHVHDHDATEEIWHTGGWAVASGYDPRGIGTNGWGMLTGYTAEEAAAIPRISAETLRGYYDAVSQAVRTTLQTISLATLETPAPGYGGKQPYWFWLRHPLFDMTRHIGEMLMLRSLWERQQPRT